jgi:hypothetical protein
MGVNPETSAESQPSAKLDQYSFGEYNLQVASFPHGLILSSLEPSEPQRNFGAARVLRSRSFQRSRSVHVAEEVSLLHSDSIEYLGVLNGRS